MPVCVSVWACVSCRIAYSDNVLSPKVCRRFGKIRNENACLLPISQLLFHLMLFPLGIRKSINTIQISSGQGAHGQIPTWAWHCWVHPPSAGNWKTAGFGVRKTCFIYRPHQFLGFKWFWTSHWVRWAADSSLEMKMIIPHSILWSFSTREVPSTVSEAQEALSKCEVPSFSFLTADIITVFKTSPQGREGWWFSTSAEHWRPWGPIKIPEVWSYPQRFWFNWPGIQLGIRVF